MTSEVKVTIVAHDGTTKEITGDTAICFTVSKAAEAGQISSLKRWEHREPLSCKTAI